MRCVEPRQNAEGRWWMGDPYIQFDTKEEADRGYYDRALAEMTLESNLRRFSPAGQCMKCKAEGIETWWPLAINGSFYGPFGGLYLTVCPEHAPQTNEELRAMVVAEQPFQPGHTYWFS